MVENTIDQSKHNTKLGLSTLEAVNQKGAGNIGSEETLKQRQESDSMCGVGLAIDISEVRKDLSGIGWNVIVMGKNTLRSIQGELKKCALT